MVKGINTSEQEQVSCFKANKQRSQLDWMLISGRFLSWMITCRSAEILFGFQTFAVRWEPAGTLEAFK